MFNSNSPSLSDIAAVTRNGSDSGFGDGNGWWILIILFAIFGGWGNRGCGENGGSGEGSRSVYEGYVLQNDFSQLDRKMDALANGICDSTFALNNTVTNGFSNLTLALTNQGYDTRNAVNAVSQQLSTCCCGIEKLLLENRYVDAQNFASLNNTICGATRDVIENQNNNYRAIHEELIANKLEAKNDHIAELQAQITALNLAASQQAQNNYLVSQLRPCPTPSYVVPNPYCYQGNYNTCNGCNNSCCG